jgi:hypothetical protein
MWAGALCNKWVVSSLDLLNKWLMSQNRPSKIEAGLNSLLGKWDSTSSSRS